MKYQMDFTQTIPAKYRKDQVIIAETARQVKKDFNMYGMDITFSGNAETAYYELFDQVFPQVENLFLNDSEGLKALLYTIDLGERLTQQVLKYSDEKMAELTDLILQRELQKVLFRHYFKAKQEKVKIANN